MRLPYVAVALLLVLPLVAALAPPTAPTFPGAVQAAAVGAIDLNWSAPDSEGASPVAGYRIYRSLTPTGLSHLVDLGNVTAYTDTGILDGAPRYYRFSAVNGDGEGPLSSVVSASAKAVPSQPRFVNITTAGRGNLSLWWGAPLYNGSADVTAYTIYRATDAAGPFIPIQIQPGRSFLDTGHPDNRTLWYNISATNAYGEGPHSVTVVGTTPRVPDAVRNVTASSFPGLGITVSWERPGWDGGSPLTSYVIYRAVGNAPESAAFHVIHQATFVTDRDCPLLETCFYRVRAVNAIGLGPYSVRVQGTGDQLPLIG